MVDGVVKILHLRRCAPVGSALGVQNFYHYDVLWYAEIIEILRVSHMKFFT
jgi:hypothetical protein